MSSQAMSAMREIISITQDEKKNWTEFIICLKSFVYQDDILKKIGINFKIVGKVPKKIVPSKINYHLFKIYKELVVNTLKHSKAKDIAIVLSFSHDKFSMDFKDNGIGFDPNAPHKGSGVKNIVMRLDQLNAEYNFNTNTDGVQLIIILNISKKTPPMGGFFSNILF
jgi:signal transduction histidine kinase